MFFFLNLVLVRIVYLMITNVLLMYRENDPKFNFIFTYVSADR